MLTQIFFSPEVKGRLIISKKHGIYELPHELPNDLKLSERPGKHQTFIGLKTL